jgi:hypothetical protein
MTAQDLTTMKPSSIVPSLWMAACIAWPVAAVWYEYNIEVGLPAGIYLPPIEGGLASDKFWLNVVFAPLFAAGALLLALTYAIEALKRSRTLRR